jgi:hypothetical protein
MHASPIRNFTYTVCVINRWAANCGVYRVGVALVSGDAVYGNAGMMQTAEVAPAPECSEATLDDLDQ